MELGKVTLTRPSAWTHFCTAFLFCAVFVTASSAQTFTNLYSFDGAHGGSPGSVLVQGTNGNLYGTAGGGRTGEGVIFEMTPEGTLSGLYSFCSLPSCADGAQPTAGVMQGADGNFYGTTVYGGSGSKCPSWIGSCGTVFKITPAGVLTTLYDFCSQPACVDGASPAWALLVQGWNGNLYGTTTQGGTSTFCTYGCGTIFEITPAGKLTTLYSFCTASFDCPDGYSPDGLVLATNGNLYGTTRFSEPGSIGWGTFFGMKPAGKFTTLHEFNGTSEGGSPIFSPIQGTDGNFYGTDFGNDSENSGTVFRSTPGGKLTPLYSFCIPHTGCPNGLDPNGILAQGTDGNYYGATVYGGINCPDEVYAGCGTIFRITPTGELSTLYSFCSQTNCTDGEEPSAGLMQATNGLFYGTTSQGGDSPKCPYGNAGCGTVFSLSAGLPLFIKSNPTFGKVGYNINVLGNNLTGTISVTFNGAPAKFTVVSDTYIRATVPTGATTGPIAVVAPSGTLTSNVSFRVIP